MDHFDFPLAFVALIPILGLARLSFSRNTPPSMGLPRASRATKTWNPVALSVGLWLLAEVFLIVALARPQTQRTHQERRVSGVEIVIALDVSSSMLAEDLGESSRIDTAKETIRQFIEGRKNDRIGLVLFSGEAVTKVPPTLDYGILLHEVDRIRLNELLAGTAIGEGLALSVNRLRLSQAKSRVIVLLTDGENNRGQIAPLTAGELAKGYGIRVYSIAVGHEGRVRIPSFVTLPDGRTLKQGYQWFDNQLDVKLLTEIARNTSGKFYRVTDAQALAGVFKEIDQLERSEFLTSSKVLYTDQFQGWVLAAFLCAILERLLSLGVLRWVF